MTRSSHRWKRSLPCLLSLLALGAVDFAAQDPDCLVPASTDVHYLWGGGIRQVFHRRAGGVDRVWTAEDGGRIRWSHDGGNTFEFATTPEDSSPASPAKDGSSQNILDVYFLPESLNKDIGWACGAGGRLLKSTDGGRNWSYPNPQDTVIENNKGEAGTWWRVRFLNEQLGIVAGLWGLRFTANGGQSWDVVLPTLSELKNINNPGLAYAPVKFEFYSLEILGTASNFVANVGGQFWPNGEGGPPGQGFVFHTESADPDSLGGTRWWVTLDEDKPLAQNCPPFASPRDIRDPWDIEFEDPESSNPLGHRGYLVGGTGHSPGSIYKSEDSGRTWCPQVGGINTMYGVAALDGDKAVACGYGGHIYVGDAGNWSLQPTPGFTAPLTGANGFGQSTSWMVGTFGFLRRATDVSTSATTWQTQNATYKSHGTCGAIVEPTWRLQDVHFKDANHGLAVGQNQLIVKTETVCSNGMGCRWEVKYPVDAESNTGPRLDALAFSGANSDRGIAVGAGDSQTPILYTADFGEHWTALAMPSGYQDSNLVTADDGANGVLFAAGKDPAVPVPLPVLFAVNTNQVPPGVTKLNPQPSLDPLFTPKGISFLSVIEGFLVGELRGNACAYRITISGGNVTATDVSPSPLVQGSLEAVASVGTSSSDGTIFAVGGTLDAITGRPRGMILRYDSTLPTPRFVADQAPFSLTSGTTWVDAPLTRIDMVNAGNGVPSTVLIGATVILDEVSSLSAGLGLLKEGSNWSVVRSLTSRPILGVQLLNDSRGYLVTGGQGLSGPQGEEFGLLADSSILFFRPAP